MGVIMSVTDYAVGIFATNFKRQSNCAIWILHHRIGHDHRPLRLVMAQKWNRPPRPGFLPPCRSDLVTSFVFGTEHASLTGTQAVSGG